MLCAQLDERGALSCRVRRMRSLSPVDEKRDDTAGNDGAWICEAPGEENTFRHCPASRTDFAEFHSMPESAGDKFLQVSRPCSPCDQSWRCQIIDPEHARVLRIRLIGIWSNDLQITVRSQRDESVACSAAGVLSARRCAHTEQRFNTLDTCAQVGRCIDEMVDVVDRLHEN